MIKSAREAFVSFYQQRFLGTFYLILRHLSIQMLTLEIHSLELLLYNCKCTIDINCENQLS